MLEFQTIADVFIFYLSSPMLKRNKILDLK